MPEEREIGSISISVVRHEDGTRQFITSFPVNQCAMIDGDLEQLATLLAQYHQRVQRLLGVHRVCNHFARRTIDDRTTSDEPGTQRILEPHTDACAAEYGGNGLRSRMPSPAKCPASGQCAGVTPARGSAESGRAR